jgi:hypothetical protein
VSHGIVGFSLKVGWGGLCSAGTAREAALLADFGDRDIAVLRYWA